MRFVPDNTRGDRLQRSPGKPIRVLIVDDSSSMLRSLTNYLEGNLGLNVVGTAHNGEESLRKVAKIKPDLVIMDFQMPGMNGLEAARELRRAYPRLRIIILSVHGLELRLFSRAYGADAFISKGSWREELPAEIEKAFAPPP